MPKKCPMHTNCQAFLTFRYKRKTRANTTHYSLPMLLTFRMGVKFNGGSITWPWDGGVTWPWEVYIPQNLMLMLVM
ncbi:conserved hypothetical protein [Ricinus communis]|uniref:Uncharacterized protein n=1 Tax=Ricinus communis TaxID=3988 RepID=B9TGY9_RICCO|nr:conserved hypothetical protein [Ricinus communis]